MNFQQAKRILGLWEPNHQIDIFYTGNKIDRDDREIPTEVGDEFSQRHSMYFLETSAKSSDNVERLFTEIAQDLLQVNFESNHAHYWHSFTNHYISLI